MQEKRAEGIDQVAGLTFAGLGNGEDRTENLFAAMSAKTAGHFLAVLAFAQVALAHVVVERHVKSCRNSR